MNSIDRDLIKLEQILEVNFGYPEKFRQKFSALSKIPQNSWDERDKMLLQNFQSTLENNKEHFNVMHIFALRIFNFLYFLDGIEVFRKDAIALLDAPNKRGKLPVDLLFEHDNTSTEGYFPHWHFSFRLFLLIKFIELGTDIKSIVNSPKYFEFCNFVNISNEYYTDESTNGIHSPKLMSSSIQCAGALLISTLHKYTPYSISQQSIGSIAEEVIKEFTENLRIIKALILMPEQDKFKIEDCVSYILSAQSNSIFIPQQSVFFCVVDYIIRIPNHPEFLDLAGEVLLKLKEIGMVCNTKGTILDHVISTNSTRGLQLLIASFNVNPNHYDKNGATILNTMISNSNDEAVQFLLGHGANPNLRSCNGETPLIHAMRVKNPKNLKILLLIANHPKTNLELLDKTGHTALSIAACTENGDAFKILLDAGAQPKIKINLKNTQASLDYYKLCSYINSYIIYTSSNEQQPEISPAILQL